MNATETTAVDAPVFFIVMKRVTPLKLISFILPRVTFEDVTNGIAET